MGAFNQVLVIEDDEAVRATIVEVLEEAGLEVRAVATLDEGRRFASPGFAGVLILDLSLADEDATALLEELADRPAAPPVVIVSARRDAPWLAAEFGVLSVPKPFRIEQLVAQIIRARSEHRRPRRLDDPNPLGPTARSGTTARTDPEARLTAEQSELPPPIAVGQPDRRTTSYAQVDLAARRKR